eukprot:TRINITY_DN37366_c0_g1_i1.p1 TRINITY_DN37366_c0_g1~~TRINITY_DN37366_c0_g1_i1.p1  ORF type:complete len:224 (+),score=1.99 TRINITY_DN37366_c0_g1_i1:44-715(+)
MPKGRIHPRAPRKDRPVKKSFQEPQENQWWELLSQKKVLMWSIGSLLFGLGILTLAVVVARSIPQDKQLVKMSTVNLPWAPINVIDFSAGGLNATDFDRLFALYGVEHRTTYRDFLLIETLSLPFVAFGLLSMTACALSSATGIGSWYRCVIVVPVIWFLGELYENVSYLVLLYLSTPVDPFVHETLSWLTWKLFVLSFVIPLIALRMIYQVQLDSAKRDHTE